MMDRQQNSEPIFARPPESGIRSTVIIYSPRVPRPDLLPPSPPPPPYTPRRPWSRGPSLSPYNVPLLPGQPFYSPIPHTWPEPRHPRHELLPEVSEMLERYKGNDSDNYGLEIAQTAIGITVNTYQKSLLDELESKGTLFGLTVNLPPEYASFGELRDNLEQKAHDYYSRLQAAMAAYTFRRHGVPSYRRPAFFGPFTPEQVPNAGSQGSENPYPWGTGDPRDIIDIMLQ
ncbi:hypothetical protein F5Y11DRAFT_336243 [Daldinia sp. FL1419]|nr:hypothetical protein F5Y11DRAFT_336243 [Daldinia sp. FL1419]